MRDDASIGVAQQRGQLTDGLGVVGLDLLRFDEGPRGRHGAVDAQNETGEGTSTQQLRVRVMMIRRFLPSTVANVAIVDLLRRTDVS